MAAHFGPFPAFSWSQTRRNMFQECPRKYGYHYYLSHLGWEADADPRSRAAFRLKQLTNLHLLLGNVVHDLAAEAIRRATGGGERPTVQGLLRAARDRLNRAWVDSKRRADWERRPKSRIMLHEFYYGPGPSGQLIAAIREKLETCVAGLLESTSYREALEAPFVEVKEVDRPDFFVRDGVTVYARPDLLYRRGGGEYRLVDWKTGEEREGDARQLRIYALYLRSRSDLESGRVVGCLEYLRSGGRLELELGEDACAEAEREIRDSISAMRSYLADPETNEPLPLERFPLRPDTSRCRFCNFYELDRAEIEGKPPPGPF